MNKQQILKTLQKYEARSSSNQIPIVWDQSHNSYVYDIEHKRYIDFTSGIFVTNAGHSETANALRAQINHGLIYAYDYPTEIRSKLVEKLVTMSPKFVEKVFLLSTGAEATECACKLMLSYFRKRYKRPGTIISLLDAMHGKTFFTENLKGLTKDNRWATIPQCEKITQITAGNCSDLDQISRFRDQIAGFMIESYRGWDAHFYSKEFITKLMAFAKKYKIPVCFDEVQGGFWRTGKMFAYEHYDVEPDLICVGKGLGNGMPISAVMGRKKLLDLPNDLTSTHSGNVLCCASALKSLELLEKLDKQELITKANYLQWKLSSLTQQYKIIQDYNSVGLLAAIMFPNLVIAKQLCIIAAKKGLLLVHTGRESVKIGPPLTVSKEVLHKGSEILEESLRELR